MKKKSVFIIVLFLTFFLVVSSCALAISALVVGDIEALVPLTYTSYLEGYPVLFFSDQLDSEQIMKILEKSSTVIFANETFYNLIMDTLGPQYRYSLPDQAKPVPFTAKIKGVYEIWAKKGEKEKSEEGELKVFIDDKEVPLEGDRQQGRRWTKLGKTTLAKGKYTIKVTGSESLSMENLLVVSEEEVEKHRLKIEKLINRHNLEVGYLFWSDESELTEKYLYLPRESSYRVKVKERVNPIQFKNIGLSLKMGSAQEIKKWSFSSANADYNYFITKPGTLVLTPYFDGDISEKELVEITRDGIRLDLEEYPYFDLTCKLEDPNLQRIEVIFGVDFDGDGAADGYFGTDESKENITLHKFNLYHAVKVEFPGKSHYSLTELKLLAGKIEGIDCSEPEKKGIYTWEFGDIQLYSTGAGLVPVWITDFKKKSFRLDPKNTDYSYFVTDDGTLSLNAYFDGGISLSSKEGKIRETEDEYVKLTIPDLDLDINEYPFLDITYKLQYPQVQHIDGGLDVDLTGDGKVDETIPLWKEKELILENWRDFPRIHHLNKTMDLYQAGLPEEWPRTYTSEYSSPDRFTVYKNGTPMQTNWHRWWYEKEWVEMDGGFKRVIIAVPKGESPEDSVYKAKFRYLPSVKKSEIFPEFDRLHIDIKKRLEETFGEQANPRLVNIHLYLKKAKDIDCSSPDKRRVYSFEIKDINLYRYVTPKEMLSTGWFRKMPLFRIAGKSYSGEDMDKITVEPDSLWYEIGDLKLERGNYQFSAVTQEGFEMNLALIEPVSVSRSVRSPGQEAQVEFRKINPTRYRVQVKTRKSFWLVFSESFHSGWKAYIRQSSGVRGQGMNFEWSAVLSALRDWGKRVELKEHYLVNGYANAWWVPVEEPGMKEFEIILEFKPQRLFEIGVLISLATLLGCVGYLIRNFMRKRKRKIGETGG